MGNQMYDEQDELQKKRKKRMQQAGFKGDNWDKFVEEYTHWISVNPQVKGIGNFAEQMKAREQEFVKYLKEKMQDQQPEMGKA